MTDKTMREVDSSMPQAETTKRIVICDKLSLISQNWEKHMFPKPDYFRTSRHTQKGNNRSIAMNLAE
ncbi:hypothetical protein [Terasakiella sp.]|uniref:hypothetical protein n=1 Tax=Terasakiella sp. TaxID=2034861 RepID=UPI003AA8F9F3